jgi:hypothetical protein
VSDQVPYARILAPRQQIDSEIAKSRWTFGDVHLLPVLMLKNSGYDSNVFGSPPGEEVSDYTADVRFGVRGIVPIGSKSFLRLDLTPEYIWYDKLDTLRSWGGLYRGELLGFFNRLSVSAIGYASRTTSILSSESQETVLQDIKDGNGSLELEITHPLFFFAAAEWQQIRNHGAAPLDPSEQGTVELLDRTEELVRGGLRWVLTPSISISAAVEETRTEFVLSNPERANRSTAYLLGIHYDRPRFYVNATGGYREGRPTEVGTQFPAYDEPTGSYFISWFVARPIELLAYGHRGVVYGRFLENSYFFEGRNAGGANIHFGRRILVHGFFEYGTNDYPVAVTLSEGVDVKRRDIAKSYGGGLTFEFFRGGALTVIARDDRFTSNIPELSRRVFRVTTGFTLEGDFAR